MNRLGRSAAVALAGASIVALAACGDDDGPEAGAASRTGGSGEQITVVIPEFAFDPDPVAVTVGDTLVWDNRHDQAHTATGTGELAFDTGNIPAGETSEPVALTEAGTFTYRCALHPFMEGTVTVSD